MIRQVVGLRHGDAAERGECLRPSEHALTRLRLREHFGQPCDGSDKFHAGIDEAQRTPDQQPSQGRRKAGSDGRDDIDKDGPDQNPFSADAIGEVTSNEPEKSTGKRRNPEQVRGPIGDKREYPASSGRVRAGPVAKSMARPGWRKCRPGNRARRPPRGST